MTETSTPEQQYYNAGGVTITNTRAILGSKTYAMTNITSVSLTERAANRAPGIIIVLVGLTSGICGLMLSPNVRIVGLIVGGLALALGIYLFISAKPTYAIQIGSASGENNVLSSKDKDRIVAIVKAMNQAIMDRG